jgi:hypothetical protein
MLRPGMVEGVIRERQIERVGPPERYARREPDSFRKRLGDVNETATEIDPGNLAPMCRCQIARRAAKTTADVNHGGASFEAETLRQLFCGGETANVELIEWREVRPGEAAVIKSGLV